MASEKDQTRGAIMAAVGAVALWSFTGVCYRKGSQLMGSMVYLTFMTGFGSATAILFQSLRGHPVSSLYRLPLRVLLAGTFGVALYTVILEIAFGIVPESDLGQINLLNLLWPIWVVVFGFVLLPDRPRFVLALVGVLFGFVGVLISRGFDQVMVVPANLTATVLAFAAGLMWAFYSVLLKRWKIPADMAGTTFNFALCSVMAALVALYSGEWQQMPAWSFEMVFWIVFGGAGPIGLAYSLWEIGVKNGPVFLIASLAYFIPVLSSFLIGLIFKETMSSGLLLGAVLIALGALVIKVSGRNA